MINRLLTLDDKEYIDQIASWYYSWWDKNKYNSIEEIKSQIINSINQNKIPFTVILLKEQELVGVYQILEHNNDKTNYTPWLANVFINPRYRNKGYSIDLLNTIDIYQKKFNIKCLYLHTKFNNFYEKTNWQYLEMLDDIRKIYKKISI